MRYILSIIGVIVFVVIAIVLIAASGSHTPPVKAINVTNYNYPGTSVSMTTNGVLNGEDIHQAIRITVSDNARTIDILSGYEQNVTSSQTFPNTQQAYDDFLQAIQVAGFTDSRITTEKYMFGACPTGFTYTYNLSDIKGNVSNLWGTDCSNGDGTMAGDGSLIQQLFQNQISDYLNFTHNIDLSQTGPTD